VAQLEVLKERIKRRREIFAQYQDLLSGIAEFMPEIENSIGNRWLTTLQFKTPQNIERIISRMAGKNIEIRPLWKSMHLQPLFKNSISEIDGTSEKLFNNGLCLPSGSSLSSDEVDFVAKSLKELVE
jgi:UDP-N-acetylbacillosamine transaminase